MEEHKQQSLSQEVSQSGKQMVSIQTNKVQPKSSQVRRQFSEIEALANSILREGQIQPIVVSPKNGDGYYVIQQGERRWRACQLVGIAWIDAIIREPKRQELEEIAGELIENIQREDLSPLEIAHALQRFVAQGWQQKEMAERLGKNSSFISSHLSLLKMADCIVDLYQANITHDIETLNNLRQLYDLEPSETQKICQFIAKQGITRQQSRAWLNAAKKRAGKMARGTKVSIPHFQTGGGTEFSAEAIVTEKDVIEEPTIERMMEKDKDPIDSHAAAESFPKEIKEGDSASLKGEFLLENRQASTQGPIADGDDHLILQCDDLKKGNWYRVAAERIQVTINILSEEDFQQGILLLDRVDQKPNYIWAKIGQAGQERLVRVPVADVELVRVEV